MKECSICGENYERWGNNAQPVNDGRCCDYCDCYIVIPTRMSQMTGRPMEDYQSLSATMLRMRKNPPQLVDIPKPQITGEEQK